MDRENKNRRSRRRTDTSRNNHSPLRAVTDGEFKRREPVDLSAFRTLKIKPQSEVGSEAEASVSKEKSDSLAVSLPSKDAPDNASSAQKAIGPRLERPDERVRTEIASDGVLDPLWDWVGTIIAAATGAVISGIVFLLSGAGKLLYDGVRYVVVGIGGWAVEQSGLIEALEGVVDLTESEAFQDFVQNLPAIMQAVVDYAQDNRLIPMVLRAESGEISDSDREVAKKKVKDTLTPGGEPIGEEGTSPDIREVPGGVDEALGLLGDIADKNWTDETSDNYPGISMVGPNGERLSVRDVAHTSPDSEATLDVNVPYLPNLRKVKFNP